MLETLANIVIVTLGGLLLLIVLIKIVDAIWGEKIAIWVFRKQMEQKRKKNPNGSLFEEIDAELGWPGKKK